MKAAASRDASWGPAFARRRTGAVVLAAALACVLGAGACDRDRAVSRPAREAPALVFIHGLGGGPADWADVANSLGAQHRVVLIGLPGHAHRAMVDSLPIATAAADVARRLRAIDGPVVLVGHSVGGAVAVRAALLAPSRVVGVALVETALRPQFAPGDRAALERAFADDFPRAVRDAYAGFASDDAQSDDLARQANAIGSDAFRRWLRDVLDEDLAAPAARLRVPVLVVLADRSWPRGEPWRATADSLGYSGVARLSAVRIENSGHFVMLDRPIELEAALRGWLAALPRD